MQGRRLLIVLLFLIVIGGLVAFLLLGTDILDGGTSGGDGGDGVSQSSTQVVATLPPTATPFPVVEIVVAVQDIPRGLTIPPNAVDIRQWPEDLAPNQAVFSIEDVVGKIARADIFREQPILSNMLVENLASIGNAGSDAAAILPSNRYAVALPVDRITSVAYAIQPGDRVDIIASLLFVELDEEMQTILPNDISVITEGPITFEGEIIGTAITLDDPRPGGRLDVLPSLREIVFVPHDQEDQRPRLVTQRTVQDALVINVGDFPLDGRLFVATPTPRPIPTADPNAEEAAGGADAPPPTATPIPLPDIITLGVSAQDAVSITWFVEAKLPMTFALRSARATTQVPTDPVTMDYIMETFRIQVPAKRDYGLQPPITSIRQLIAGEQIAISGANGDN